VISYHIAFSEGQHLLVLRFQVHFVIVGGKELRNFEIESRLS